MTDATIAVYGGLVLFGWLTGAAFIITLFWRRLTRPAGAALRGLQQALDDDADRVAACEQRADNLAGVCSEKQRTIDELTAQIAQLYIDQDRLARRYVEAAAAQHGGGAQ